MAGLGRIALAALGILAYQNRDKLGEIIKKVSSPNTDPNNPGGNENVFDQAVKGGMGGLSDLLNRLKAAGSGDAVDSWMGKGANQPIGPANVEAAIDEETLESLIRQTGMSRQEILDRLAVDLPKVVDEITPEGTLPEEPTLLDPVPPPPKP
ncbi:YidB family protein [Aminobacter anthyllidis]|uniref:YidB family protein n=1 Tax=Aminobacter anthyllidis TaxID=1035067 RepID=A0A9X1AHT8_9HYPH|nr:YidB family protein [Aminobacter anthyllidis]MBT1160205.1 YidB family protein [Aminobacter anthyllidis]